MLHAITLASISVKPLVSPFLFAKSTSTGGDMTNFGFDFVQEKLEESPNCFFKETAFLRVFIGFMKKDEEDDAIDEVPESLD